MKFNLKMIAAAAALASMAGAAQADIVTQNTQNGSLVLTAFNTATNAYYIRDLGFTLNTFLPTGALNSVGLIGSPIVGDKTPEAGLLLNAGNTTNFADSAFSSWYGAQTPADVKWFVNATDTISQAANGVSRFITSSVNPSETASNSEVSNFVATSGAGGIGAGFFNPGGLSKTGTNAPTIWASNFGLGADGLAAVGQSANLFYFTRTVVTGSLATPANGGIYGNSANFSSLTLATNGNLTYSLEGVSPVPLPAAAWLMGAGLMGLAGVMRRRKAAAQAV